MLKSTALKIRRPNKRSLLQCPRSFITPSMSKFIVICSQSHQTLELKRRNRSSSVPVSVCLCYTSSHMTSTEKKQSFTAYLEMLECWPRVIRQTWHTLVSGPTALSGPKIQSYRTVQFLLSCTLETLEQPPQVLNSLNASQTTSLVGFY